MAVRPDEVNPGSAWFADLAVWRATASIALAGLLSACGGEGQGPASCDFDCLVAPAPTCDGTTQIGFQTPGVCEAGFCRFEPIRTECAHGCTDGVCVVAACDSNDCTEPPADRCDGNTVLRYNAGACVEDECVYPATVEDCTASGDICRDAQCVPPGPGLCDGVTCDAPPADRCDGDVRVVAGAGACNPADGLCSYAEERTDCAADGGFCRNGRCFAADPCSGVTCDEAPAPSCDGDTPVSYQAPGVCVVDDTQPDGYRCQHVPVAGTPCTDGCVDGACIDPGCTFECTLPPANLCTRDGVARRFAETGVCVDGERCRYPVTEQDCTAEGLQCDPTTVTCVADPCDGVDCSTPPAPSCDGNIVVTSTGSGSCTAGECTWAVTFTDCGALFCDDGACVERNPCSGITCGEPAPAPFCDGSVAVTSFDVSYCLSGSCRWDEERVDCVEGGGTCVNGACVYDGRCPGGCSTPPADTCLGTVARDYPSTGVCGVSNTCEYLPVDTNCRTLGLGCVDGRCIDICEALTCDTPPAPRCDGGDAVTYAAEGECSDGVCAYEVTRTRCAELGLTCDAGECVTFDFCPTIVCETPPQAFCDGNEAVSYSPDGTCNEATDACEYASARTNCTATGRFCFRGSCQATDPCAGIACDVAPADTCSADTAIRSIAPGECTEGVCAFDTTEYWCGLENAACLRGECVGGEFCDGLDCAAEPGPTPYCDRDVRITFAPRCRVGLCLWDIVRTDCRATGDWCYDGECIDVDPCSFTTCETPPADTCDGDMLYRYDAAGSCAFAECSYDVDVFDCRAADSFCAAGACRPNDNPCGGVVCDEPGRICADNDAVVQRLPGVCELGVCLYADAERLDCDVPPAPRCEGRVAVVWSDDGACEDGDCVFSETRVDCASSGRYCDAGQCVLADPCVGITCGPAPAAECVGDSVVVRAAGVCDSGTCRYDVTSTQDCASTGQICAGGACVDDPSCTGLVCEDPPADYCIDTFRFTYVDAGTCSRGECDYAAVRFDCRGLGQVCSNGECVPPASCDGVDCSGPPPAPVCDGDTAVTFFGTGDCAQGACVYLSTRTDCGDVRGGYCEAGACANVCDGVVCNSPPPPTCLGSVAITYSAAGLCDAESGCTYTVATETRCADDGLVCQEGACVDPCAGVVCDDPPAPICLGADVATWSALGECSAGTCLYDLGEPVSCGDLVCVEGECVPFDPCTDDSCPAGDFCSGSAVVRSATPGTCVSSGFGFLCEYDILTTVKDCADSGELCVQGACAGTCEGVVCPADIPFCVGNLAVVSTTPGECTEAGGRRCEYADYEVVQDCAELPDATCVGGFCADACAPITCAEGQAFCDGTVIYRSTADGTCSVVDGNPTCQFVDRELIQDCADLGTTCANGGCEPPAATFIIREVAPELAGTFAGHAMVEVEVRGEFPGTKRFELYRLEEPGRRFSIVLDSDVTHLFTSAPAALLPATALENAHSWSESDFVWPAIGSTLVVAVDGIEIGRVPISAAFPWSRGVSMELSTPRSDDPTALSDPSAWCAAPREVDASGNRFTPGRLDSVCELTPFVVAAPTLGITEIYFGDGGTLEWFEILNPTAVPIDLSGVSIINAVGESWTAAAGTTTPRARALVFVRTGAAEGVSGDVIYDVALSGASGTVTLLDREANLTQEFGISVGIPVIAGASTQVDQVNADHAWCSSSAPFAAGRFGSPGAANHSCIGAYPCTNPVSDCPSPRLACTPDDRFTLSFVAPPVCGATGCEYHDFTQEPCPLGTACSEGVCE